MKKDNNMFDEKLFFPPLQKGRIPFAYKILQIHDEIGP